MSLFEIGCGPGANLLKIIKEIPKKQIGGIDVNPDAIELAKKIFNNGVFQVGCADDIMLSDKSSDVVLSDMVLIYVSPKDIRRHIQEIYRITRNYVVLCEFHAKSRWKRLLLKIRTGYNAHNFQKLLEQNGFYDVSFVKMREVDWPGFPQNEYGYLIIAKKC
ncbi:MAG: class I SAM-dependent methyltransferase [Elusimicrobia bacterium]|nr:class I SAM-dependent methyltransferase [Elusimicrobiota bacterium]